MADFHPVAPLDLIAFLAILVALVFLWKGRKREFLREAKVLFIALILFSLAYNLCLFLEWSGLADTYETLENFIGALIPMWWAFVTYAFLQEIAQRELRNSESRYQDLYDNAPDMFASVDSATAKIIQCNRMLETVTGYSREHILGRPVWNLYPADLHEKVRKAFETFRTTGLVKNLETQMQCQDGRRVDVVLNASAVRDKQGRILYSRSVLRDITEQKQAERALRFTRFAVDHTSDAAFWMRPDARFVYVNESACRKLGYSREELLAMSVQDIDPDFSTEIWPQHWQELKENKSLIFESHHRTKTGEIFPVDITANFLEFEGKEYNCAFARDITERKQAEKALRESENRYRTLFEGAPDAIFLADPQTGKILDANPAASNLLRRNHQEIVGLDQFKLHPSGEADKYRNIFAEHTQLTQNRQSISPVEGHVMRSDGSLVPVEIVAQQVTINGKSVLQGVFRDITERKQAELALKENERFLHNIFNAIQDGLCVLDTDLNIVRANICMEKMYAHHIPLPGKKCYEVYHNRQNPCPRCPALQTLKTGETHTTMVPYPSEENPTGWINISAFPLKDAAGQITGIIEYVKDITEHKRAEERFRLAAEIASDLIYEWDVQNDSLQWFGDIDEALGYQPGEIPRTIEAWVKLIHPEDVQKLEGSVELHRTSTETIYEEYRIRHKNGDWRYWIDRGTPVLNNRGRPYRWIGACVDITERKRAEEEMQKLAAAVKHSSELINLATLDGRMIFLNEAGCTMLGIETHEVEQVNIMEVIPDHLTELVENELLPALMKGDGWEGELQYRNLKTKELTDVYAVTFTVQDPSTGAPLYLANVSLDITDRKRVVEALRELSRRNEALLAAVPDIIAEVDVNKKYTWMNPAGYEFFGDDALHHEAADYFAGEQKTYAAIEPLFKGDENIVYIESWQRRRDGEKRLLAWWCRVLKDAVGNVIGALSTARDITERKWAEQEREKLIAELEAKNAELERFTYTVSHDLKSPLITTKGFVGMLEKDLAEGNQGLIAEDMQRISHATETMERLLDELLELSRIGRIVNPPEEVAFSELAQEALALLSGEPNFKKIHFEIDPDLPVVQGDRIRLQEVLQNLIENAIKFMEGQPEPRIEIGVRQNEGEHEFFVRDNGIGIEPRYHEKIFGLFDKLNHEAAGTGIGLAIVKRIVEVHGGSIRVESEGIGHGSTFCFTLPAKPEGEAAS